MQLVLLWLSYLVGGGGGGDHDYMPGNVCLNWWGNCG